MRSDSLSYSPSCLICSGIVHSKGTSKGNCTADCILFPETATAETHPFLFSTFVVRIFSGNSLEIKTLTSVDQPSPFPFPGSLFISSLNAIYYTLLMHRSHTEASQISREPDCFIYVVSSASASFLISQKLPV